MNGFSFNVNTIGIPNVCTALWNLQHIKDLKMTEWSVETCSPIISSNKCCADVNIWLIVRPFGLYCSACFGSLFVSILCTCCSHFSWYCFISFTMFCAPVFCLIHRFRFFLLRILRASWCPLERLPARRRVSVVVGLPLMGVCKKTKFGDFLSPPIGCTLTIL